MFGTFTLTALLASASVLLVRADVVPNVPGPGVIYKEGETCHIEWNGDAGSTTAWKNMAIQLMTGDNFNMVHLTTVGTGLDGTVNGKFDHPCPAVIPNSAIYFYQFSATGATTKQWTTRFTIASPTGATSPPSNANQPGTNAPIPWGTGALADPSKAVPPPASANNIAGATGSTTPTPPITNSSSSPTPPPVTVPQDPNTFLSSNTLTSRFTTVTTSPTSTAAPTSTGKANSTSTSTKGNAATAVGVDTRVWQAAVALGASAMAFAVLL